MPHPLTLTATTPPRPPAPSPSPPNPPSPPIPPLRSDSPGVSVLLPARAIDPNPWRPHRPTQPPPDPEDDLRLTASIARQGVQENILVRPIAAGRYQLVFGARRLRCAIAAGLTEIPAIVRAFDDHQARRLTLADNLLRQGLHFLDQADALGGLVAEGWTLADIAADLGKPLSWAARRHRLLNLTPAWRGLADRPPGWLATWSAADFEQIAILAPEAQEDLLARQRHQIERCVTARELAQLVRSLTSDVAAFPWSPEDATLDPLAGACNACPHRGSQHPGLLDNHASVAVLRGPSLRLTKPARPISDRCLNPVCAGRKAQLFLERRKAELAARYGRILLLQEGWLPRDIPDAVHDWEVTEVERRTRGARRALVANGPNLGTLRWVKLPAHPLPPFLPRFIPPATRGKGPASR
jgi:ParB/RepB/Spo0J family partition protein